MSIPGTVTQLIILIVFVLPGLVYQSVRSRLRGPTPDELDVSNKLLRSAAVSTVLALVYMTMFGPEMLDLARGRGWIVAHPRPAGAIGLLLLFVVPVIIAGMETGWDRWNRRPRHWLTSYDPTPGAWDFAFRDRAECFVRVLTGDDQWVGGWFDPSSFATSFPQPRELFIAKQWKMSDDGAFEEAIENSRGVFIRCGDARVVEFIAPAEHEAPGEVDAAPVTTHTEEAVVALAIPNQVERQECGGD